MFEFALPIFHELMCVVRLHVVKNDRKIASGEVESVVTCFAKCAAIFACDVAVIPTFLVLSVIKSFVTFGAVSTEIKLMLLLRCDNHVFPCEVVLFVLFQNLFFHF